MLTKLGTVVVVLAAIGLAVTELYVLIFGKGTLHVVTAGRSGVELIVDGKKGGMSPHYGGIYFSAEVTRGRHTVQVTDKGTGTSATYTVNIATGFSHAVLPVRDDQCFVRFKVKDLADPSPPIISERYPNTHQPIEFSSYLFSDKIYFEAAQLPRKLPRRGSLFLMRSLPCSMLNSDPTVALDEPDDTLFPPPPTYNAPPTAAELAH